MREEKRGGKRREAEMKEKGWIRGSSKRVRGKEEGKQLTR